MDNEINYEAYRNDDKKLEELWQAAHMDALTGLYNRYGLDKKISEFRDQGCHPAILAIDIDNFKYINDRFGHMLGDALLKDIASMMKDKFGEGFVCGRTGGDEFVIFSDGQAGMIAIGEKARALCNLVSTKYGRKHSQYGVTLSIGIAVAEEQFDRDSLLRQADLALYQAKQAGKNRCAFFTGTTLEREIQEVPEIHRKVVQREEQIGDSGFSVSKILLNKVMNLLEHIDDPKEAIQETGRAIVESYHVTRAYACCYTEDEVYLKNSYFYEQGNYQNVHTDVKVYAREYARKFFNEDGIFFCTDVEETDEPMRSQLKAMKVETFLQIILQKDGRYIGLVGINNCSYRRLWLKDEIETLHTIANLLKPYIYRMQQEDTEV